MHEGEKIVRVYYHHYLPYAIRLLKVFGGTLPFYFLLFLVRNGIPGSALFAFHVLIVSIFTLVTIYVTLIYWLDRLVVTNKRIVFIDWKYLTVKSEAEAELRDIQDITSHNKGVIALIPIFDYGTLEIKTASNKTVIRFPEIGDPDAAKKFVHSLIVK